ncbi:cleavage factor two Cft2/polyadenylation factor CPSF-73 [Schizosaccharomyces japonicus yFS275]|uniref:Cleavage and polyadenylation specificity factor subunit 2 n=1 Tax=Schizosaccharomyces japonicus (strain yFS275 / FY16936) TaxID=402676 RepID=B6K3N6_SCHJY|nr:cleavage factor two Cft2/polyadenylation factor CPSF-73 [Schizosaccharomyces japonicus yFS275]EEB08093.1 cleavage factor two Cft2/polyadenylation factor CPSF-73 [Schizosaccharomyces japonicus yFS275]
MLFYWCIQSKSSCGTSLLELDGVHILIDPGSDNSLTHPSIDVVPDLILLSHSDLAHLGGLVYACRHYNWKTAFIYATLPVINMGRMTMYDAIKSNLVTDITIADVDLVFDSITTLRYSQPASLMGKCNGINITAFNAGHTLGGTLWSITKESESLVYAVDWNHSKDKHLNGTALYSNGQILEILTRPNTLVTDANNALISIPARKKRDEALIEAVMSTLLKGGSVLLPMDAASRVIELCYFLDTHWASSQPPLSFPIYFLSYSSAKTIGYAKSMIEWMGDNIVRDFGMNESLLEFRHIQTITHPSQLSQISPGPKVIIATSLTLESGFSQNVLLDIMPDNSNNLILLTQKSRYSENSLAKQFYRYWERASRKSPENFSSVGMYFEQSIQVKHSEPLQGEELREFQEKEQSKRTRDAEDIALELRNRTILDEDESEESSSDEDELTQVPELSNTNLGSAAFMSGKTFDLNLRDPNIASLQSKFKMFPYVEKRRRFDDYGEILRQEDFAMEERTAGIVEGEENEDYAPAHESTGKRKWAEVNNGQISENQLNEDMPDVPSKIVTTTRYLKISCQVAFIDMEGLHDGRSLKTIIPQVNPRRLVLIHATDEERADMKKTCAALTAFTKDVYCPDYKEVVNVSIDVNSFNMKLSDELVKSLIWKKLGNYEVAHLMAKIRMPENVDEEAEESKEPVDPKDNLPILDSLKTQQDFALAPRAAPIFVGNVRLAALRKTLMDQGISVELKGEGVLLCGGIVAIRKLDNGRIVIEGGISNRFFEIRKTIYDTLAMV